MTIQAWWLLRKLKRAQTCPDGKIVIDPGKMTAVTVCLADDSEKQKTVSLKAYQYSLDATLGYLENLNYFELSPGGEAKVTYAGWYAFSATVAGTARVIILNVLIPIAVSVIAAIVTTLLISPAKELP